MPGYLGNWFERVCNGHWCRPLEGTQLTVRVQRVQIFGEDF